MYSVVDRPVTKLPAIAQSAAARERKAVSRDEN